MRWKTVAQFVFVGGYVHGRFLWGIQNQTNKKKNGKYCIFYSKTILISPVNRSDIILNQIAILSILIFHWFKA